MQSLRVLNSRDKNYNELSLSEKDFHPCEPFFINHQLSKVHFDKIFTKGVFEVTEYCREVIKRLDDLLKVNGILQIDYFVNGDTFVNDGIYRPLSFFMHEFSLSTGNRYVLDQKEQNENECSLFYRKKANREAENDTIESWTFGIVSDGKKNERVLRIVKQIIGFNIKNYQIVICGPSPYDNSELDRNVLILDDQELYLDTRVPITKKKNKIIQAAKYENIVIMHDRISFSEDWYEKILKYGNQFEILCPQILAESDSSLRLQDWLEFDGQFADKDAKGKLLKYGSWTSSVYVDGGLLIAKTRLLRKVMYNENLHWGEAEDVDLSKRLYLEGGLINLFTGCKMFSETQIDIREI